jgi:hypothetical protein
VSAIVVGDVVTAARQLGRGMAEAGAVLRQASRPEALALKTVAPALTANT